MKFTIYKIESINHELTKCYIGISRDMKNRIAHHKSCSSNINSKIYNYEIYKYIRANGGWDNFKFTILRDVDIDGNETKGHFERMYFEIYGGFTNCLNNRYPNRTPKETSLIYYYNHYNECKEKIKQYNNLHKEQIKAYRMERYQKTKNIIALIEQQPELII